MASTYNVENLHGDEEFQEVMNQVKTDIESVETGSTGLYQPLTGNSFTVENLPTASENVGRFVYVTDGSAGSPCGAVSDGTNWKVVAIGATVSAT